LHLHGHAQVIAREMGLIHWSISLSYTHDHAMAVAFALQGSGEEA
jgi:phosphopantetheinyl transferase (holo-ACP synthase)